MDSRRIQGKIEEYSFLELAKAMLPDMEFPIMSYPYIREAMLPNMESLRAKMIPRFHYITKDEEQDILNGNWNAKKNYENSEMPYGFYFLDVQIGKLGYYFPEWFKDKAIDTLIKPYYEEANGNIVFAKMQLTTAVFCILHEYGHYLDYKKLGKEEMTIWVHEAKNPVKANDEKIRSLNAQGKLTKAICEERNRLYRQCADEHSADIYALSHLKEKVNEAFEYISGEAID